MSSSADSEQPGPARIQALPQPPRLETQSHAATLDVVSETSSTKAKAEEVQAVIRAASEGLKAIFETPGWMALFQGYGQAAACREERLTAQQAQEHERQVLILKQNHERIVQLDRQNHEQLRMRNALSFRLALAFMGMLLVTGVLAIAAIKLGWIDEKVAAVGGAFLAVSGTMAVKAWSAKKGTPSTTAPTPSP